MIFGENKYLISGNGAEVYDIEKKETIYSNYISKDKVLDIIKICEENSIYYSIYTENSIITTSLNYNVLFYHNENSLKQNSEKVNINIVENLYKYIEDSDIKNYSKITICDRDKAIFGSIIRILKNMRNVDVLDVTHMSRKVIKYGTEDIDVEYFYTEIMSLNVNKWNAVSFLIDKLGIKQDEVIAIGDNINDKEMIENAGLGVAMGNSSEYVKSIAKVVVSDNNNDGVAYAINKYTV